VETDREFTSIVSLPQFPGPSTVTRRNASDDPDQQTAETVERMQAISIEDAHSPQVWAATQGALHSAASSARVDIADAIYRWVCSHVRFRSDEPVLATLLGLDNELDLLIRPTRLLTMSRPAEDCDGFTMLCCSMLLCAGVPCEIVTIKADHEDPTRFSHVYCQAIIEDGSAVVMDCSQGSLHQFPLGWEAPEYFARKEWGVMHPAGSGRKGLHGLYGLGQSGEVDIEGGGLPGGSIDFTDIFSGGSGSSSAPFDVNKFIQQLTAGGLHIATMQATPVGYVQTPNMVANYGPGGAIPSQIGGIGTGTLLLGVGGLALALMIFGKK